MDTVANNFTGLIAFVGARQIISDLHDTRKDYLSHPIIKIIIVLSILYIHIKDIKITILLFFIYILFLETEIKQQHPV
jgi:hypothetical protein